MRALKPLTPADKTTVRVHAAELHQLARKHGISQLRYVSPGRLVDHAAVALLVTHRFSTVAAADIVLVLEAGRIVERGTHEELMAAGGTYAELCNLQARGYR